MTEWLDTDRDPVLLVNRVETNDVVGHRLDAEETTGRAILIAFAGRMLVNGEQIAGSRHRVVIPIDAFPGFMAALITQARASGVAEPTAPIDCPSRLLVASETRAGFTGWYVLRCGLGMMHAGSGHVAGDGTPAFWTDQDSLAGERLLDIAPSEAWRRQTWPRHAAR